MTRSGESRLVAFGPWFSTSFSSCTSANRANLWPSAFDALAVTSDFCHRNLPAPSSDYQAPTQQSQRCRCTAAGVEFYRGIDAYDLLLRIASGLESEVPGESEIFGQFKQSWQAYRAKHPESCAQLRSADARPLRGRERDSLSPPHRTRARPRTGVSCVPCLARMRSQPTLLIGAGEMAAAILPYLSGRPLYIANRTPERASPARQDAAAGRSWRPDRADRQ